MFQPAQSRLVGIVLPILLVYLNCLSVNNESASLQPDLVSKSVGE
jgi:hypothetical protein